MVPLHRRRLRRFRSGSSGVALHVPSALGQRSRVYRRLSASRFVALYRRRSGALAFIQSRFRIDRGSGRELFRALSGHTPVIRRWAYRTARRDRSGGIHEVSCCGSCIVGGCRYAEVVTHAQGMVTYSEVGRFRRLFFYEIKNFVVIVGIDRECVTDIIAEYVRRCL